MITTEAGREYRAAAEQAIEKATPTEMRQLVLLYAGIADGLSAKVLDRNSSARTLLTYCKIQDRGRRSYFDFISTMNTSMARVRALSPILNFDHREALIEAVASRMADVVAAGCPDVQLPDESVFPVRKERQN